MPLLLKLQVYKFRIEFISLFLSTVVYIWLGGIVLMPWLLLSIHKHCGDQEKALRVLLHNFRLISIFSSWSFNSICKDISGKCLCRKSYCRGNLSWHLLFQSQQWKHQNNVWNLCKINNKDVNDVVLVSLLLTLNMFHTLF